jgi:hypothetical protein
MAKYGQLVEIAVPSSIFINLLQTNLEAMKTPLLSLLFLSLLCFTAFAQVRNDEQMGRAFFDEALERGQSYEMLRELTQTIGGRLSGSPEAAAAVEWSRQVMEAYGFDTVWLQPVMVPHWDRGAKEKATLISEQIGSRPLNIVALGNSVGTGPGGITAEVIEVQSFEELEARAEEVRGKWVFFNRPMDPKLMDTFSSYGGAAAQRSLGPSEAAKYGAVGAIVRSLTTSIDDIPHTGSTNYQLNLPQLPAVALSTRDAELLSERLALEPDLKVYVETHSQMLEEKLSFNVIGEIKGSAFPDTYLIVGGHLDSWDLGEGAHDDGAGCVQSIEALRLFKALGIRPRHTLRAVMFMNEENGLRGGRKYAEEAQAKGEKHLAAMESDRGGFLPIGFGLDMPEEKREKVRSWAQWFEPYGMFQIKAGGGGADISPLKPQGVPLLGFLPDSQRYFDVHHTAEDTFDKVNKRELEMGAAGMAFMLYLIDKYGL